MEEIVPTALPPYKDSRSTSPQRTIRPPDTCINNGPRVAFTNWDGRSPVREYLDRERSKFHIDNCSNISCRNNKDKLQRVAPSYESAGYSDLRDWVLNAMSCLIASSPDLTRRGPRRLFGSLYADIGEKAKPGSVVQFCTSFISDLQGKRWPVNLNETSFLGICELFQWVSSIAYSKTWASTRLFEDLIEQHDLTSKVIQMTHPIPEGICKFRHWNLITSTDRGIIEMLSIASMLKGFSLSKGHLDAHGNCTVQICLKNDENTTIVPQHHVCSAKDDSDPPASFPVDLLNSILDPQQGATAWSISGITPKLGARKYMAISHVWSDGTGVGLNGQGNVNQCLIDYFKDICKDSKIQCDGIWWDTISLPTDKDKRTMALNKMHTNYQNATCTLVHDLELANFTWKDDGRPCLALAFSTWFSRGWTALELQASKNVWVPFKDSDGKRILKNLDSEVLASPNDPFAHPAHKAFSNFIRRFRPEKISGHQDTPWEHMERPRDEKIKADQLLNALRPRYTCWSRDRSIIAGLMSCEVLNDASWFDSSLSQVEITKATLTKFGKLNIYAIFHDRVPICNAGPWSWCPPQLFDLSDSTGKQDWELELRDGKLSGVLITVALTTNDREKIRPLASHTSLVSRIMAALNDPEEYYLLNPPGRNPKLEGLRFALVKKLKTFNGYNWAFVGTASGDHWMGHITIT